MDEVTDIKNKAVEKQNGKVMSLVKEVVYAWQIFFRQAQMQRSREISLCFFISQAVKKLLHRTYFRRCMKYTQKGFEIFSKTHAWCKDGLFVNCGTHVSINI